MVRVGGFAARFEIRLCCLCCSSAEFLASRLLPLMLLFSSITAGGDEAPLGAFSYRSPVSVDNHRQDASTAPL